MQHLGEEAGLARAAQAGHGGDVDAVGALAPLFDAVDEVTHASEVGDLGARIEQVGGGQSRVGSVVHQGAQVCGLEARGHVGVGGDGAGEAVPGPVPGARPDDGRRPTPSATGGAQDA